MIDLGRPDDALARAVWAKSRSGSDDWFPLDRHLGDAAAVAEMLYDTWFSTNQQQLLADSLGSHALARSLAVWLAAAHDCGKCSVPFAVKMPALRIGMEEAGFTFPFPLPSDNQLRALPHGLVGYFAVREHLQGKSGFRPVQALRIAEMIGGHHGVFPGAAETMQIPSLLHTEAPEWAEVRRVFLERADTIAELDDERWEQVSRSRITQPLQALLTGFLIVCDWIASNDRLFPYELQHSHRDRAQAALSRLRLPLHWRPELPETASELFSSRFGIDAPRPMQSAAVQLAQELQEPTLMLIEASTGEGKTEAALAAAEVLAQRFGANGVFVALPTRATSDAMFSRVLSWLHRVIGAERQTSVMLAHSKAEFDEEFQALFQHGGSTAVYDDGPGDDGRIGAASGVAANLWFAGRKRSALAQFVVATIDQGLFTTLKAKHTVLRHLGLGGKVVILDEIHAADEFMGVFLSRLLEWLGTYGTPVIALSATLPPARRMQLLSAYRAGARYRRFQEPIEDDAFSPEELKGIVASEQYPLLLAAGAETVHAKSAASSGRNFSYSLEELGDEDTELIAAVQEMLADGGCVAVVRNTVARAQQAYALLREQCDAEVILLHSRFTIESRRIREQRLVARLGPDPTERPKKLVVVATQVIESSLDLDFDLMITDFAPMDSLIQRLGRVHRHQRPTSARPSRMRTPRVLLTGGSGLLAHGDAPPEFDDGSVKVYGEALLLRSAAALQRCLEGRPAPQLQIPEDVVTLIHTAFDSEAISPHGWEERWDRAEAEHRQALREQRERARAFAIGSPKLGDIASWNRLTVGEASEEQLGAAQVRDAEASVEVVLVRRVDGRLRSLPWLPDGLGDQLVDFDGGIEETLARAVATCTVSLPSWITRGRGMETVLNQLERNGLATWQQSHWLKGMLPLILDHDFVTQLNGHRVIYDQNSGLHIEWKEQHAPR